MPENAVIVDAGPLVAMLVAEDTWHEWAAARLAELEPPLLCCEAVLTETSHLVQKYRNGPLHFAQLLKSGVLELSFRLVDEREALISLMRKYADLPMSLADACLVRMAERYPRSAVFTLDGHFRIYRKHGRQQIPLIIPPTA